MTCEIAVPVKSVGGSSPFIAVCRPSGVRTRLHFSRGLRPWLNYVAPAGAGPCLNL